MGSVNEGGKRDCRNILIYSICPTNESGTPRAPHPIMRWAVNLPEAVVLDSNYRQNFIETIIIIRQARVAFFFFFNCIFFDVFLPRLFKRISCRP